MAGKAAWGSVRQLPSRNDTVKKKNGRWQARYPDPERAGATATARDKATRRPLTFDTKADALRWLSETRTDLGRGVFVSARPALALTVTEQVTAYMGRRPTLSPRTIESYRRGAALYIDPTIGKQLLGKVTADGVADWWADLLRALPESKRGLTSRFRAYELLRAAFAEAVEHNLLDSSPCRLRITVTPEKRPHITVAQVGELVEGMPERWRAGVLLAATTGLRFGEMAGLRLHQVDLLHKRLTVATQLITLEDGSQVERAPKTAAGRRTISIPPHLVPILEAHLSTYTTGKGNGYLFTQDDGQPLAHRVWNYRWDRARKAADLPGVHFHDLRHAALTLLAQSGATLAELMSHAGHATPAAAIRYQRVAEGRGDILAERLSVAWGHAWPRKSKRVRATRRTA